MGLTEIAINEVLSSLRLSSFQSRVFVKLASFAFSIKKAPNAPVDLKAQLAENNTSSRYAFRESTKLTIVPDRAFKKYGELTFKNFFSNFFNKIKNINSIFLNYNFLQINQLKYFLYCNQRLFLDSFLAVFPRFHANVNLNLYDFRTNQTALNTAFYKN